MRLAWLHHSGEWSGFDSQQSTSSTKGVRVFRFKKTTRFEKQCNFIQDLFGELVRCDDEAEHGFYFGDDLRVQMVSLCKYHSIYQESLWRGGEEE
jgi:hypothetical protein